ncbi:MAG: DUF4268 domain-containing protein [Dehalococcoidia bacterium]
MSDEIGRIKRVNLRDVWKHEAQGLTKYLENNIDVLSELIDLELSNVEREKPAGDFSVDLTAEDQNHNLVVIENQLERSDHDHLGKIVTYLSSLGATVAIWIVAKPRAEHVKAVSWLNESGLANFYLLQIEAIKIADSPPAPLLTLITGPSEETRIVGETKKNISERHGLRKKWWTELLDKARSKTKLHANISPSDDSWVTATAGKNGLGYDYVIRQHSTNIELHINCPGGKEENKRIFDQLYSNKKAIEASYGGELTWLRMDENITCRIVKFFNSGGYRDEEPKWPRIQDEMIDNMIRFSKALTPFIDKL